MSTIRGKKVWEKKKRWFYEPTMTDLRGVQDGFLLDLVLCCSGESMTDRLREDIPDELVLYCS